MTDLTMTVSLSLAQQAFLLDAIDAWRRQNLTFQYTTEQLATFNQLADALEDLIGPIPEK